MCSPCAPHELMGRFGIEYTMSLLAIVEALAPEIDKGAPAVDLGRVCVL